MKNNFIIENNIDYSSEELKQRKKLIKFLRGTHERFKKGTNFEKNAKDYITSLFEATHFDEDEQVISTVLKSYRELSSLLRPLSGTHTDYYRFLTIVDCFFNVEYIKIVERFYR